MGLLVPTLTMASTGMTLANAYMAISRNPYVMTPVGSGQFTVHTQYNTWYSLASRQQGKDAIDTSMLTFTWSSANVTHLYQAAYGHLTAMYPDAYPDNTDLASASSVEGPTPPEPTPP
jgi:hypothetical protein